MQVVQLELEHARRHLDARRIDVADDLVDARAVRAREPVQHVGGELWKAQPHGLLEALEVGVGPARRPDPLAQVSAGQEGAARPRAARRIDGQRLHQQIGRLFGQSTEGGDLAAPYRQQRRLRGVELQRVVARDGRRVARLVVEQRPHAGIRPHDILRRDRAREVAARLLAQVVRLRCVDLRATDRTVVLDVGGADQREVVLVRDREDDALVGVLEDVGMVVLEQPGHDDVAALDQPQRLGARHVRMLAQELRGPWAGGIDQRARRDLSPFAARVVERDLPLAGGASRIHAAPAREHRGTALGRVDGVQRHQARVVDPAVRIDEALGEAWLQRGTGSVATQVDGARRRQHLAARQVVVQEQACADHPHRAHARVVRHHEAQRPHDVRRTAQQHLALGKRLAHQRELTVLQIAQAAMDQLGARRRGGLGQVVLFAQHHLQATAGEVARDAGAVDAAAYDQYVA